MIEVYLWVFLLQWEMDFYYFSEFVSKTIFIYLAVVIQVTSMWETVLTISTNISKHCSLEEQIKLGDI